LSQIPRSRLEKAETHFKSIAGNPSGLRNRDIDWKKIKTDLNRLAAAVEQGNAADFDESFAMLKDRLPLANVLRGKIGPAPKDEPPLVPPPVFELLNHIVHKLHLELERSPARPQKSESTKQNK
jgi:hypothetical protein